MCFHGNGKRFAAADTTKYAGSSVENTGLLEYCDICKTSSGRKIYGNKDFEILSNY